MWSRIIEKKVNSFWLKFLFDKHSPPKNNRQTLILSRKYLIDTVYEIHVWFQISISFVVFELYARHCWYFFCYISWNELNQFWERLFLKIEKICPSSFLKKKNLWSAKNPKNNFSKRKALIWNGNKNLATRIKEREVLWVGSVSINCIHHKIHALSVVLKFFLKEFKCFVKKKQKMF